MSVATVVLLKLMLIIFPLLFLGMWGIFPTRRLVILYAIPTFLTLSGLSDLIYTRIPFLEITLLHVILGMDGILILGAFCDLFTLPRASLFKVTRVMPRVASLRKPHFVQLKTENHSNWSYAVQVCDDVEQDLRERTSSGEFVPLEQNILLQPRLTTTWRYRMTPHKRGGFTFTAVFFRFTSRLGLWRRYLRLECPGELSVYPDLKQLEEYALMARTDRLHLLGVRKTRKIGQDNEFERLRDYTVDDNYRHVDWRATARRRKLTVRDFQATQNQNIIFMLDTGRMMLNTGNSMNGPINALLMMAWVALKQGDSVGLLCFSDTIHSFLSAKNGMRQMNGLLHAVYDRFPEPVESRYDLAFHHLASHVRRRSLVVLITNVIDEINASLVQDYLTGLSGRHLSLGAMLRDHQMYDPLHTLFQETARRTSLEENSLSNNRALGRKSAERILADRRNVTALRTQLTLEQMFWKDVKHGMGILPALKKHAPSPCPWDAAAAADLIFRREHWLTQMRSQGVLLVDAFPEELTARLVNRYLEIKARHLL